MKNILALIFMTVAWSLNAQLVTEDFDLSDGGWTGSSNGGNDQWQHGMPAGTGINDDNSGGGSAWVTGLSGSFSSSGADQIFVTSPTYDLSSLSTEGSISVAINLDIVGGDWAFVEYSINNGVSWNKLGTAGSGDNWYDNASEEVWTTTANTSGAWVIATQNIPGDALGESGVRFRFVFDTVEPAGPYPAEGFAIDDFQIFSTNVSGGGAGGSLPNEDFDLNDGGWAGSAISGENYWAWGFPAGTQINDDNTGGGSAWVTGLSGDFTLINGSETMYLTSTAYDLSSLTTEGAVSLALNVDLASGDFAHIEYLINDGFSIWTKLGASGSGINWYDDAVNDAWSANSGGWGMAAHDLPFEALGEPSVSFRVVITSSVAAGSYGAEGLAIDDFQVVPASTGGGGPGGGGPGTTQIKTMTLAGEIFPAVIDSTSNSVKLFVSSGTNVTALAPTFTLSDGATVDLPSGSTQNFTSAVTYTVTSSDGMENKAWAVSAVVPDLNLNVYPQAGLAGTNVTILGRGFSTTASENTLTLGGVSVPVVTATANKLTFQIPADASLGLNAVAVSVNGLNSRAGTTFNVLASNVTGAFADYKEPDFNLNASSFVKSMQVGDIDNDGDLDFAYDNETILNIATIQDGGIISTVNKVSDRNNGSDSFDDITFVDADQDGFLDIVVGGFRLGWFKNNGDGTWADEVIIDQTSSDYTLSVFDIDGDFDMDILAYDGFEVLSFTNNGSGSFALNNKTVPGQLGPIVDWDADGDIDVLRVGSSSQNILLARNDGKGNFAEETLVSRGSDDLSLFQFGDLDNDGDLDFVVGTENFGTGVSTVAYVVNNNDGTFGTETSFITEGAFDTRRLELADLNNDGFLDVVRTRTDGTNTSHAYYSSGSLTYPTSETLDSGAGTLDLVLVDIEGDGDMDVLHEASASGGYFPLFIQLLESADITGFSLTDQTGAAAINTTALTVEAEVANTSNITSLTPTVEVSVNAAVVPASGVTQDFTNPVAYTVTAEDGTVKNWTVSVFLAPAVPVLTSSNIGQTTATLSWNKSNGGINYELELSEASDFSTLVTGYDPLVISNPSTSTVAVDLVNLNAGTTYYARVREQNGLGTYSAYSTTTEFTTKLPSQPDLSSVRVDENAAVSTLIGTFSVTDADGASYTYAFADGGVDNASFSINGSNLETNEVFNREVKAEYSIRVQSVNPLGVTSDPKEFTITINDLNDAPTNISLQTGSYNPTGFDGAGTGVADLFVTDEDGDNITFVLTQGGDSFEVNNVTKTLLTKVVFETEVDLIIPITLEASDPSGASVSESFNVTIKGFVDTEKPVVSPSPQNSNTFLSGGPERSLSVTVTDFRLSQVKFFSRLLTESEFVDEVVTEADGAYTKTVVEADLGVAGFEYYFEATDEAGNVGFSELKTMALSFPESGEDAPKVESVTKFGRTVDSYQIISIPFAFNDPSAKRVDAIFNEYSGDEINTEYRIIRWDPTRGESGELVNLDQASTIELGEGYFFISAKERSITIESANINLTDPFPIALKQGWNLIGNPFNINMDWTSILANNSASAIVGPLRVLDPENPETWPESTVLKTLEGAFVFANQDITLNISYTDASISFGGRRAPNSEPQADWFLPITLEQNGDFRKGGIGMDAKASTSLDIYDEPVLPKWLEYLELAFIEEGERFSRLNKDVTPVEDTRIWKFEVSSSSEGMSTLTWDENSAQVANLKLYNAQNGTIIDMTHQSSYDFNLAGTAKFEILYSEDPNANFEFRELNVLEAYPNPFTASFRVPLHLPSNGFDYEVRVEMLDLSGRTIFTGEQETVSGGVFEYSFERPQGLKQGLYLYKVIIENALITESFTKRIKVD